MPLGHVLGKKFVQGAVLSPLEDDVPLLPVGLDHEVQGVFRDARGVCWRRRPNGQLDEIPPEQMPRRS